MSDTQADPSNPSCAARGAELLQRSAKRSELDADAGGRAGAPRWAWLLEWQVSGFRDFAGNVYESMLSAHVSLKLKTNPPYEWLRASRFEESSGGFA